MIGGIPEFDPVGTLAIFVEEPRLVLGHEFIDEDSIQVVEGGCACGITGITSAGDFDAVVETVSVGVAGGGVGARVEFLEIGEAVGFEISKVVLAEVSKVQSLPGIREAVAV